MNTKKMFIAVLLVLAILLVPVKAFAAEATVTELYQADFDEAMETPGETTEKGITYDEGYYDFGFAVGEYKFMEDIDLGDNSIYFGDDGEFTFNLNGKTITNSEDEATIGFYNGTLTITGEGTIENSEGYSALETYIPDEDESVNVTIENGTFVGGIEFYSATAVIIEDATVQGSVKIDNGSNVTIQDGTYTAENSDAVYVWNGSSVTINGGTFTSPWNALMAEPGGYFDYQTDEWVEGDNPAKVVICGGTFTAEAETAASFWNVEVVTLKGGTFTVEGEDPIGAILATVEGEEGFLGLLGEGFKYSEDLALEEMNNQETGEVIAYYTQASISVIPEATEEEEEEEEAAPEDLVILDGADQTFEGEDIIIRCSGEYSKFVGLTRNGEDVDKENYEDEEGSTIVTLKATYLASLDAGVHTFAFLYNDGRSVETTVTIPEPITPKTGDTIAVYITLFVVAVFGTIVLFKKK